MDDEYFMDQALHLAKAALKDGEFPVGCVIVYEDRVVTTGARVSSKGTDRNELDHAEIMALRGLSRLKGHVDPGRIAVYSTLEPCLMCFGALLITGVGKIVYAYEDAMGGGTHCMLNTLPPLYQDRQVSLASGILRQESLALFQSFFANPENEYLKGTFLADYTLRQPPGGEIG